MDAPPVQYVTTGDGYDIAYRVIEGTGPPLLFQPPLLIDINRVWRWFPDWMEGLARRFTLIQFDCRGQGFSTRNLPAATTVDDFYRDLEAVIARVGMEQFFIWGWAMPSNHLAVKYAATNPGRVSGLILNTCRVSGVVINPVQFTMLPQENWDLFLTTIAPPGLGADETKNRVHDFKACMTRHDWDAFLRAFRSSDVSTELRRVLAPALVMHPRSSHLLPAKESMHFAALIADARFQLIDGNYIYGQADGGLAAIDAFLGELGVSSSASLGSGAPQSSGGLSLRELEVLGLLAAGKSNQQIAEELVISQNTVRRHVSNIFDKTGVANRVQAVIYARDHGVA